MTTTVVSERPQTSVIGVVARRELRLTLRSRWFWLWTVAFVGLAGLLMTVSVPGGSATGARGFGRTAASLVTLVQVIVPLMGLTIGALAIAGPRESGALRFLLSHPISRFEAFTGVFFGLAAALAVAVFAGFGFAGLMTLATGVADVPILVGMTVLAWVLSVSMLGVGMLISTFTRTAGAALGVAVFAWLVFVFVGDLGLMGTWAATRLPVGLLFAAAVFNPIEAFRLSTLAMFSGSLDVLGPAGSFAIDTLGSALSAVLAAALLAWVVVPVGVGLLRFMRRWDA